MKRKNAQMNLQITSMADVFVIILVFLLKSYASSAMQLSPSSNLKLPEADHTSEQANATADALKIEISENAVLVEGRSIASLDRYGFKAENQQTDLSSINQAISMERKRQDLIASVNTDVKKDTRVIVMSDAQVPYGTLKEVLKLAAGNGYSDYQFAVVKNEGK